MCLTHTQAFDAAVADAFALRLIGMLNDGAIMLMTSIGHRTGLFDAMSDQQPVTSQELAEKSKLSERYVREWLGAMTTARFVTYDPSTRRYTLPPEHAQWLSRSAERCFAVTSQWVGVMASVEDDVIEAFHHGRGVPYEKYSRFVEVMAEDSGQNTVAALDDHILPIVPGLIQRLERGIHAVDVGCGSGLALIHLAKRFPKSQFVGLDLLDTQIASATARAKSEHAPNVTFRTMDVTNWDEQGAYDLVMTFDAVHDQSRPDLVLRNIRRALRPEGVYLMQDIKAATPVEKNVDNPLAPFIYTISCIHCMSVSLANNGMGLGAAWGKELALQMLQEAGFAKVEVRELPHDILNYYYIARPD
jgi:2-polyprenyl-3-methyl-5-hydroxy-6-metoxy-1,4-benzoquinol methylase